MARVQQTKKSKSKSGPKALINDRWEVVTVSTLARTSRLAVDRGWLVLVERSEHSFLEFVSDPGHNWKINPPAILDPLFDFRFLHLTGLGDQKRNVQVNIGEIALIEDTEKGTKITLKSGGPSVTVKEAQSEIIRLMQDHAGVP